MKKVLIIILVVIIVLVVGAFALDIIKVDISKDDNVNNDSATFEVNAPLLTEGMTPIKFDENNKMVVTTEDDKEWYDYSEDSKKWANAMTEDGSLWVWIPRYAYKITSGYHSNVEGTIEVEFLNGTTDVSYNGTKSAVVNQGNNPGSDTKFVTHPAFKFGNTDVEGIWVAKFEATNKDDVIAFKPNEEYSHSKMTISEIFEKVRSMENTTAYGFTGDSKDMDTHLTKDVEWGAASYLAVSKYGKNSEVEGNNMGYDLSAGLTGCGTVTVEYDYEVYGENTPCSAPYDSIKGQKASTTGNIYGIYDMNGGAKEYTASYLKGSSRLLKYAGSLITANPKYVDIYEGSSNNNEENYLANIGYYGNGIYETSSESTDPKYNNVLKGSSWYGNSSWFLTNDYPISLRGDEVGYNVAGIFAYSRGDGNYYGTAYVDEIDGMVDYAYDEIISVRTTLIVGKG